MKNRKLVTTCAALALVAAIGVGSTFAYLSSTTNNVVNTFSVGDITFVEKDNATLFESKVARENGTGVYVDADGADTWTSTGNKYTNLVPGESLVKDPTVIIEKGSVSNYLFFKVRKLNTTIFEDVTVNEAFTSIGSDDNYNYYVTEVAQNDESDQAFTIFSSLTTKNFDSAAAVNESLNDMDIQAVAIQKAGFANAEAAFEEAKGYFTK